MFEKSIGLAMMAALVWGTFHFFGDVATGPRAAVALAPVYDTTQLDAVSYSATGR